MNLQLAGVETDERGYVRVNEFLQTSAPHIYAAGDIIGYPMLAPNAMQEGFFAAANAVAGPRFPAPRGPVPVGSFTDPEYASVGLTETQAYKEDRDYVVGVAPFDAQPRCIIDGRTRGFCKLVVDRDTRCILGAHVVGERAVETIQMAAVAIAADITADMLEQPRALVPHVRQRARARRGWSHQAARPAGRGA